VAARPLEGGGGAGPGRPAPQLFMTKPASASARRLPQCSAAGGGGEGFVPAAGAGEEAPLPPSTMAAPGGGGGGHGGEGWARGGG
jgi:hypothetical protein